MLKPRHSPIVRPALKAVHVTSPATILHFAQDGDTSGYFPHLAKWRDRTHFRMLFGTLGPLDPELGAYMRNQDVATVDLGCRARPAYPQAVLRLASALRRHRVDVLHTHLFEPSVVGLVAGKIAGTPIRVLTRHYSDYHTRIAKRWHTRLDKLCTSLAHSVIAVSRHTADHLIRIEGAPPEKVHVVLNGIDLEQIKPSRMDARESIRSEMRVGDAHLILVLARLHPEKGHEYLFRALPTLRRRVAKPIVVLLAGDGPFEDAYREQVAALGCGDMVRFLGFRRDAPDLITAADVFVLPSVAEAFGIALVEALYLRAPVVATTAGGIPEIVEHGVDGVLVPPADSDALASAIASLLEDPQRRERLRSAGRDKVLRRFGFESMVRAYESVYERLLSVPHQRAPR